MGGLLVAVRVVLALVEREAGHRARRAAGFSVVLLSGLFIGLAGLLFVLYAIVLALGPYLSPAGAAALVGAAMILVAAILIAVTFRRPQTAPQRIERAATKAASDVGNAAIEAGRKLGAGIEKPNTLTIALAALIAGLVAGRKL